MSHELLLCCTPRSRRAEPNGSGPDIPKLSMPQKIEKAFSALSPRRTVTPPHSPSGVIDRLVEQRRAAADAAREEEERTAAEKAREEEKQLYYTVPPKEAVEGMSVAELRELIAKAGMSADDPPLLEKEELKACALEAIDRLVYLNAETYAARQMA